MKTAQWWDADNSHENNKHGQCTHSRSLIHTSSKFVSQWTPVLTDPSVSSTPIDTSSWLHFFSHGGQPNCPQKPHIRQPQFTPKSISPLSRFFPLPWRRQNDLLHLYVTMVSSSGLALLKRLTTKRWCSGLGLVCPLPLMARSASNCCSFPPLFRCWHKKDKVVFLYLFFSQR